VLVRIAAEHLPLVWELVQPHLERVVERTGERYSLKGVAENILAHRWQLWGAWDERALAYRAVAGTEVYNEVSGLLCCNVLFASGLEAERWTPLLAGIEEQARHMGCKRMLMMARKGWARRLPDYKMTHVVLEKGL